MRVEAIYNKEDVRRMFESFDNARNCLIFAVGVNTGFRIGDILRLKKSDVQGDVIQCKEQKTGKYRVVGINKDLRFALDKYFRKVHHEGDYLFPSQKPNKDGEYILSTTQAYRIMNAQAKKIGLDVNFGTHSLRKTWAYHMYKECKDVAFLMKCLNHSSPAITLAYIGAGQQEIINTTKEFNMGLLDFSTEYIPEEPLSEQSSSFPDRARSLGINM